jgi:hypothetical protein
MGCEQAQQNRRAGGQAQWCLQRRPPALNDVHAQRRIGIGPNMQAQYGGRGLRLGPRVAHYKQKLVVLGCGAVQAAQLLGARLGQPGEHSVYGGAAQSLLAGPQGIGRAGVGGAQPQQTLRIQALGLQRRSKGPVRRRHQRHRACAALRQRRQKQAPLGMHARVLQKLGQSPARPTATGQLGVQQRLARGHRLGTRRGQAGGAPDVGAQAIQGRGSEV